MRCAVLGCHTDNQSKKFTKDLMFFRFPNNESLIKKWVTACKRGDKINVKNARVCSKHFDEKSYEQNLKFELLGYSARNRRLLKSNAIPFINLPVEQSQNANEHEHRNEAVNRRDRSKLVDCFLLSSGVEINADVAAVPSNGGSDTQFNVSTKRDISTSRKIDERDQTIAKLKQEVEELKNENRIFKNIFTLAQIRKFKNRNKHATLTKK